MDPARDKLLALFATAITAELTAAWALASPGTALEGKPVVNGRLPLPPTEDILTQQRVKWPLLAVYRDGQAEWQEWSLAIDMLRQTWTIDYLLGPLTIDDERKLADVLVAVSKVVTLVLQRGGHPSFEGGALQFLEAFPSGEGGCRFTSARPLNQRTGRATVAEGPNAPRYLALTMQIETTERTYPDESGPPFDGATLSLSSETDEGAFLVAQVMT